jgi:hypothetical protein
MIMMMTNGTRATSEASPSSSMAPKRDPNPAGRPAGVVGEVAVQAGVHAGGVP